MGRREQMQRTPLEKWGYSASYHLQRVWPLGGLSQLPRR